MSVLFCNNLINFWKYSNKFNNIYKQTLYYKKINSFKYFSHDATNQTEQFIPFLDLIKFRQLEAKKSLIVQVQSTQSFRELHTYCSGLGTVKNMFHYTTGVEPLHFIVVEFANEEDVKNILTEATHIREGVPTFSQFLWFRASNRKLNKLKQSKKCSLSIENGTKVLNETEIIDVLQKCDNVSEQIQTLYNNTKLNELGTRLRFLTARQIELSVSGMFPNAIAYPFGSSVNGYGKMGCDLDLVLKLINNDSLNNEHSRLVFHCKAASGTERSISQRHMESVGDLIHLFLPGCAQVRRILQARVPIIKFHQQLTDVECDLSMSNMSGIHMSDFLYIMGGLDGRVRPLVFTIRKWARDVGLTNSSPGRWITNFSLTLLVLAFLQNPLNSPPILPSLNTLTKLARPRDKYIIEDGTNCTFLRDVNEYKTKTQNTSTLESLLIEFFQYYSQFDFQNKSVCLNESVSLTKPDYNAMYIVNPIERGLNVSKNMSQDEVDKFLIEIRNAAWMLETENEAKLKNWGILSIMEKKQRPLQVQFNLNAKQKRLMDVSRLFDDEQNVENNIEYKNRNVKQQIDDIKKQTQQQIKKIEGR